MADIDIDWNKLERESDRMLAKWEDAHKAVGSRLSIVEEGAFDYGFELGWRLAKGEVIE